MTATNDPLARVQAMVDAWGSAEAFDTFDTTPSEVSPPKPLQNCGVGHFRHFRHQGSEPTGRRDASAPAHSLDSHEQGSASRVSYSQGVESVESVENAKKGDKDRRLGFDTWRLQVSKNAPQVSKTGHSAVAKTSPGKILAPENLPVEWVEGVARLADMPCPAGFPAVGWKQVVSDAEVFLKHWAATAHRLGWPTWELFGCHCRAPWGRIQGMGLVLLLRGHEIAALTATEAVIRTSTGAHQTYRRKPADPLHPAERCLVWELETPAGKSHEPFNPSIAGSHNGS